MDPIQCPRCQGVTVLTIGPAARLLCNICLAVIGGFVSFLAGIFVAMLITTATNENLFIGSIVMLAAVALSGYVVLIFLRKAVKKGYDHLCGSCEYHWLTLEKFGDPISAHSGPAPYPAK